MIQWIGENIATITVGTVLVVLAGIVLFILIKRKKNGTTSCGGCADCPMKDKCNKK